ncbi:MAG: hypothetical protein LKF79_07510, partial [Solobacterium sp.]|nr:hypothetical protein [Solobacterium sp.]MCH4266474.1 hypothetical protein [Solobacterium sp.]
TFQFTLWALLSLILLIAVLVYFIIRNRKMKNQQNDLEDQLEEFYDKDTVIDDSATHKAA